MWVLFFFFNKGDYFQWWMKLFSLIQRKNCLLLNNLFLLTGALFAVSSRASRSFEMIVISRFLVGISAGMSLKSQVFKLG